MNTAKLRMQGNEQLAILPDGFQLVGEEVYIKKVGNAIILTPKNNPWQTLGNSFDLFSDDFMETREQPPSQEKEELFSFCDDGMGRSPYTSCKNNLYRQEA